MFIKSGKRRTVAIVVITALVCLFVLLIALLTAKSVINLSKKENAIAEIEKTGIEIGLAEQIEVISYGNIPGCAPDKHFKLKAILDEKAYRSIITQLTASNTYYRINNTEEDYSHHFGPSNTILSGWGISLTDVTDTYYGYTSGKVVMSLVTSYVFAEDNGKYNMFIDRWG